MERRYVVNSEKKYARLPLQLDTIRTISHESARLKKKKTLDRVTYGTHTTPLRKIRCAVMESKSIE